MASTDKMKAERNERIERQALESWHRSASSVIGADIDWRLEAVGSTVCSISATEPSILINRVLGLGASGPPTVGDLTAIRRFYEEAGVSRFFLHVIPGLLGEGGEERLADAGYERYRAWMKFTRGREAVREPSSDLTVRRIGAADAKSFASIAGAAFDFGPAFFPVIAALVDDPDCHIYMSFDGDSPAGTGGIYIKEGAGYLDWGATAPEFRRRGSQTAVLSARLNDALDEGVTTVVTMTGEAVPGDPQHSYSNILRAGFSEAYLRENWIPVAS